MSGIGAKLIPQLFGLLKFLVPLCPLSSNDKYPGLGLLAFIDREALHQTMGVMVKIPLASFKSPGRGEAQLQKARREKNPRLLCFKTNWCEML